MIRIDDFKFGMIKINNAQYHIRDVLIFPDGRIERRSIGKWIFKHHSISKDEIERLQNTGATWR